MRCIYNGIDMQEVQTIVLSWEPRYDGPNRMFDEVTYEGIFYLNPQAVSYSRDGVKAPEAKAGELPASSISSIRTRLLAPRGNLVVSNGATNVIFSPPPGKLCDVVGGPKPYRADVEWIAGLKTFAVRFGVQTCLNPCISEAATPAAILSARWASEKTIDQDGYSTRVIQGHATFDVGALLALGRIPDQYFDSLVHPLDDNWRRVNIQVQALEDATELTWVVTDKEMPLNLENVGIARCEIDHHASISRISPVSAVIDSVGGGIKKEERRRLEPEYNPKSKIPIIGPAIDLGLNLLRSAIPMETHTITVRLWGNSHSKKFDLEQWGVRVIMDLLAKVKVNEFLRGSCDYVNAVRRDGAGKFVELTTYITVPAMKAAAASGIGGVAVGPVFTWPDTPPNDDIDGVLFDGNGKNPPLPGGDKTKGGTRGTWLGKLVAQAMTKPCQKQAAPPAKWDLTEPERFTDSGGVT